MEKQKIISREDVKRRLKELLSRKEPMGIVIRGEWGVGKTHLWKEFVRDELKEEKHAYISLFGKYSLEDIKSDLTAQLSKFGKFSQNLGEILEKVKAIHPYFDTVGSLLSLLTPKEFKDVIVCFDEFERISPNLELKEIFGFMSYLKENLNCRLVLIVNENRLKEELGEGSNETQLSDNRNPAEVFNQYKEKLVDYELELNPSIDENLEIVLNEKPNVSEGFKEAFKCMADLLEIKNIRILRRLVSAFEDFSFIEDINELKDEVGYGVKLDFYKKLILISFVAYKYNKTKEIKKLIKKIDDNLLHEIWGIPKNEKEKFELQENEKEIKKIMDDYLSKEKFLRLYSEDVNYICEFIESNFLHEHLKKELTELLIKKHEDASHREISSKFNELVQDLKFNFSKNLENIEEEILKLLSDQSNINAIISSYGIISFVNTLLFIKWLTQNPKFDEIAKKSFEDFVKTEIDELLFNEMDATYILSSLADNDFREYASNLINKEIEKVREKILSAISCEKVVNIISDIFKNKGWDKETEKILNSLEKDFIKNCFVNFVYFAEECIKFYRWNRGISSFKDFLENIKKAVDELDIEETRKEYIKNLLKQG